MIGRNEFDIYVKKLMENEVINHKYLQKEYINSSKSIVKIGVLFMILSVPLVFFSILLACVFFALGVIFFSIGSVKAVNTNMAEMEMSRKYKEKIIDYLLKDYKHQYSPNQYIPRDKFKESKFVEERNFYDSYQGEDYLSINIPNNDGTHSDCNLVLSDLKIIKKETYTYADGDIQTRDITLYDAMFGYVEFPFEFNCTLTINSPYYFKKGLKRVELESIEFNNKFVVYSTDQVESRYILTPTMMEKIMYLNKKMYNLMIVMDGHMMYIGCKYKKLFQLSAIKTGHVYEMFSKIYDDVILILELVEEIKNNDKVFRI